MYRILPRIVALICLIAGLALPAPCAFAHAIIVEAVPSNDAVVHGTTVDVKLRYNNRIDHARSRLLLLDANGNERPITIATDSPTDQLIATITDVVPGQYRLRWQVLALDGHITRGDIPFTVVNP
jgi:copper resistance protein C